jgi:aquaporin Z
MAADVPRAALFAEFLGTYMLVFAVGCNVITGSASWAVTSIAMTLMIGIYSLGAVSGANFNPAVSFALALTNPAEMDWGRATKYMVVQILGGIAAALSYGGLFWDVFNLAPAAGFSIIQAGFAEFFYTFFLVFMVLNCALSTRSNPNNMSIGRNNEYLGLAIGFSVIAGGYGAGHISGGCFNPAVAIAIDVSSAAIGFGYCLPYVVFEFAGAFLAVTLFHVCRPEERKKDREERELVVLNMINQNESYKKSSRLVSEFIGTFMLVLTVGLNVLGGSKAPVWSIAASLMCGIFALGNVSGGHFNPAVTLAITMAGEDPNMKTDAAMYMLVQILGGFVAAMCYALMEGGKTFPLAPGAGHTWGSAYMAETVYTFVLAYVVLTVACYKGGAGGGHSNVFALAIASCVTAGGYAIGAVSGGSLNPAVSCGIALSSLGSGYGIFHMFPYVICEFIGGAIAATVYGLTHKKTKNTY